MNTTKMFYIFLSIIVPTHTLHYIIFIHINKQGLYLKCMQKLSSYSSFPIIYCLIKSLRVLIINLTFLIS